MRYATVFDPSGHDFRWSVHRHGYSIEQRTRDVSVAEGLVADVPIGRQSGPAFAVNSTEPVDTLQPAQFEAWRKKNFIVYAPADRTDLHRRFAETRSADADALTFVSGHGLISQGPYAAFVADFFAGQELIRGILQLRTRSDVRASRVEELINRNRVHFLLRVAVAPTSKLVQQLMPRSLLGWMLLQALRELTGLTLGNCEVCGVSFEITDERKVNKKFCSDRCRQKNFRERGRL